MADTLDSGWSRVVLFVDVRLLGVVIFRFDGVEVRCVCPVPNPTPTAMPTLNKNSPHAIAL